MRVLLCTPYKSAPDIVRGGINQWGQNILAYYKRHGAGLELIPISFDRHISRISSRNVVMRALDGIKEQLGPILNALRTMRGVKPDVVHICTSAGMGCLRDLILVRAAKYYHIKSIVHLHFGRLPELAEKRNWEWNMLISVIKRCDIVVPMNKPTEAVLKNHGFNNTRYLPNPLSDMIEEQVSELKGIERIPRRILYVGHVYKTKGVVELVEGCSGIDGIKLIIAGKCSKEMYNELLSIGSKEKKGEWIDFIGEISHQDVLKEFLKADLFVFPSYTEGFPNVILEAMACGCPIVATKVGAIPEMLDVENLPCGICINPESSKEVRDAIISVLNNNKLKEVFVNRAKQRVSSMYSVQVVWKELLQIWAN